MILEFTLGLPIHGNYHIYGTLDPTPSKSLSLHGISRNHKNPKLSILKQGHFKCVRLTRRRGLLLTLNRWSDRLSRSRVYLSGFQIQGFGGLGFRSRAYRGLRYVGLSGSGNPDAANCVESQYGQ